ncbi:MAG: molecular chaperone HtpG [Clostridia bacterium]|nr:molecular chaperone HtpG [Clostridia bacterium]
MAKKQFKTESKRILDLMINSIYTHKEIFLRELISNASDAIDKLCYLSLTDQNVGMSRENFKITVSADKDARRITVSDNGIGMSSEDLERNLGIIANSGSLKFRQDMAETSAPEGDIDIIGQFGVGFYSAFMVAKKVAVISRAYGAAEASLWTSEGADGYTIKPCEKDAVGTDVVIELKDDLDGENYSDFLEEYTLRRIIKKYSDYIRWPIKMGEETVNSMVPVWQRSKTEATDEDCTAFYKEKFHDAKDPAAIIRINAEGTVSYRALLFIPGSAPYNYYSAAYEPGLQLYTSGVMIMEKCDALLPEYFRFVQGVVDSQDLSLNISRELLQHDRQLKIIAANLEKKIKSELKRLMDSEREKYEAFYKSFGLQLRFGCVSDFGMKKDLLSDLLLFRSSKQDKLISLKEYVDAMPAEQKYIYYACAESAAIAAGLPQAEPVRDHGFDILYLTENMEEFCIQALGTHLEKTFKSVNDEDLGLETEAEKEDAEKAEEENKALLDFIVETLGGRITVARISKKLKTAPVCLTTQGPVSLEMEKYFASIPTQEGEMVKAERVLELNASHPVFAALSGAYAGDRDKAVKYAKLLYGEALLIAGLPVDDPTEFSSLVSSLMI